MNIRKVIAGAVTALLVGGGLALATAIPASAHTPVASASCTGLDVSLTSYSANHKKNNHVTITVDGDTVTDQDFGTTFVKSYPSTDQYSGHTYKVHVKAWDDSRYNYDKTFNVAACLTNPAEPTKPPSYTDWTDSGTPACGDTLVSQTRVRTDYTYTLVDHKWIEHTATKTETQSRALSDSELAALAKSCAPVCPPSDFKSAQMWEVTWGYNFADRNGGAPKFTMASYGGLTGINGGPIPSYMNSTWHWLYVNMGAADYTVTYNFADGTTITAVVTGADCTPNIVWKTTPPVVVPPKPELLTTVGDWTDSDIICDETTVEQTRVTTTEDYKLVDNVWVLDESTITTKTDTQTRDLTAQEIKDNACPVVIPTKPEPIVTVTHTDKTVCDSSTVETTTITVTTDWVYDEESNTWAEGPQTSSEPVVTTRAATEAEVTAAECAVVVPPVVTPPVVTTPVVTPPAVTPPAVDQRQARAAEGKELAVTGQDLPLAAGLMGIAVLVAGIGFFTVAGIQRRRNKA